MRECAEVVSRNVGHARSAGEHASRACETVCFAVAIAKWQEAVVCVPIGYVTQTVPLATRAF